MPGEIFISYARNDDQAPALPGAKGFVSSLHDRLLANFKDLGDPQPTIFQDYKHIMSNEQFEGRLQDALGSACLMVIVLSRNWLTSDWCKRELEYFLENWRIKEKSNFAAKFKSQEGIDLTVGGKVEEEIDRTVRERIFVVRKHAIEPLARPVSLQGQSGYDLLKTDKENNEECEYFSSALGRPEKEEWFTTIWQLAKDLRHKIADIKREEPVNKEPEHDLSVPSSAEELSADREPIDITVYLAHCASDMESSYTKLVEELRRRGVRIVPEPDKQIPTLGHLAQRMIDDALRLADLSIHLLGDKSGFQPEELSPIVRFQLERAAARVDTAGNMPERPRFHRIIWAPRILPGAIDGAAVRDLLSVLARHAGLKEGIEPKQAMKPLDKLDGDTLTKFIQFVLHYLAEISRPAVLAEVPTGAGGEIYVLHHRNDAMVADQVAEGLQRLGFNPTLPLLKGGTAGQEKLHRDNLKQVDSVLCCWAKAGPVWVRAATSELRSWRNLGRAKAFCTRAVISLPPKMPDKERLRKFPPKSDVDLVIDATAIAAIDPTELDPMLRQFPGSPA